MELPSIRQPANATDTASNMVLSGQSSASAHSAHTARLVVPVAAAKPRRIRCKQQRLEQGCAEQMVMSGDLGSQVSECHQAEDHDLISLHSQLAPFYTMLTKIAMSA